MELLKIKGLKKNYINEKQVICALKSINLTVFISVRTNFSHSLVLVDVENQPFYH